MIHMNRVVKYAPGFRSARARDLLLVMPELYIASSITDILESRKNVKPTRKLIPLGVFFYNRALINLTNSVVFTHVSEHIGNVVDLNANLDVNLSGLYKPSRDKLKLLADGKRIYRPWLLYHPKTSRFTLIDFETHGPIKPERSASYSFLERSVEFG